jgi:hypothetical protein
MIGFPQVDTALQDILFVVPFGKPPGDIISIDQHTWPHGYASLYPRFMNNRIAIASLNASSGIISMLFFRSPVFLQIDNIFDTMHRFFKLVQNGNMFESLNDLKYINVVTKSGYFIYRKKCCHLQPLGRRYYTFALGK